MTDPYSIQDAEQARSQAEQARLHGLGAVINTVLDTVGRAISAIEGFSVTMDAHRSRSVPDCEGRHAASSGPAGSGGRHPLAART